MSREERLCAGGSRFHGERSGRTLVPLASCRRDEEAGLTRRVAGGVVCKWEAC